MASMNFKTGQIKDRTKGYNPISYCVPRHSKSYMKECLKAHELITSIMPSRSAICQRDLRAKVILYVALDRQGKQDLIKTLSGVSWQPAQAPQSNSMSMEALVNKWIEQKICEGASEKQKYLVGLYGSVLVKFFNYEGIATTADLAYDTAHKFLKWRSTTNLDRYKTHSISASVLTHNLQFLKQIAKFAHRLGYISNGSLWDDTKVKTIVGVNRKVVEPLPIETQKELLKNLMDRPGHHDIALLLLITGMRIGEMATLEKDSIRNGALCLHGEGIGNFKPSGGKTASAARTLPVCPTLLKLFERGNIFSIKRNAFRLLLQKNFKGIHAHRLRHTFAVNNLLSQKPLQMVSYQMGHSETSITADLYGKFVPEHFKAGFEEAIRARKELVNWLENDYFK